MSVPIEETVFKRKRFVAEAMEKFGFVRTGEGFVYEADILGGDFHAVVTVAEKGCVSGRVIDNMNEEEYAPLRMDSFNGGYVNSVRHAYEEFLGGVAEGCCKEVVFASDQANRVAELILDRYSVSPDFPWGQSQYAGDGTFRHPENNKWFALIMNIRWNSLLKNGSEETVDIVNLKIDPEQAAELAKRPGVFPAYHMNKKSWITVLLNETLSDGEVMDLVDRSFNLTK